MPKTVKYTMEADIKNTLAEVRKVVSALKEAETAGDKLNKKHQEQKGVMGELRKVVGDFKSELVGLATAALSYEGLKLAAEKYLSMLEKIDEKQVVMGKGLRELAMKTPGGPGDVSSALRASTAQAARLGITPDDMARIKAWAKDVAGADDIKAVQLAKHQVELEKLGYERESTQGALAAMVRQGKSPREAARIMFAATQKGTLTTKDMARLATSVEQFRSIDEGLAVASALKRTGQVSAKQLPSMTAGLSEAFDTSKIAKSLRSRFKSAGLNYEAASIEERLAALEQFYGHDERKLMARGLSADQARAIAMLQERPGAIAAERAAMAAVSATSAADKLAALEKTPELAPMYMAEKQAARAGKAALYGPSADAARRFAEERAAVGSFFMESKKPLAPWMYDQETGMAGPWVTKSVTGLRWALGFRDREEIASDTITNADAKELISALKENTEATRNNTKSAGGGTATPQRIDRNAGLFR